ncbi:MAG: thiamine-binding protein [Tindallia sp. MSAO_Bac2]|nr:MAG: thiamine-binding protein [Tindallia sp. MSAO_Bac2]
MANANVGLQVLPSVADEYVYGVVDQVIQMIQDSGVKYEVGPLETTMEGDLDELMEIVKEAQKVCIQAGAGNVMSVVKIQYRPEGVSMDEKVAKHR